MPTLAALTINSTNVNVQELYEESISDPVDNSPVTIEMLNGGLNSDNHGGSIPPWAVQPGAFVRAIQVPFSRWEFVYAKMLSSDGEAANEYIVAALSTRVFLPWDCHIAVGWQALWRHDATLSINNTTPSEELWTAKFFINGSQYTGSNLTLSASRFVQNAAGHMWGSALQADEDRWPWSSNAIPVSGMTKGYLTVLCKVSANIKEDDEKIAKLLIPSGSLWVLAVRR